MTIPRNEHADYVAYEDGGLDAVVGIPHERALTLAQVLTGKAQGMDPRHPATAIVKRDVGEIYKRLYPEQAPASQHARSQAERDIAALHQHPAYLDANHPDHNAVSRRMAAAYAVRYQGE